MIMFTVGRDNCLPLNIKSDFDTTIQRSLNDFLQIRSFFKIESVMKGSFLRNLNYQKKNNSKKLVKGGKGGPGSETHWENRTNVSLG